MLAPRAPLSSLTSAFARAIPARARAVRAWRVLFAAGAVAILWLACGACGSSVTVPRYVGQPTSALVPVNDPPPPARVEVVPKKPASDAVWIDGEWVFIGRHWAWKRGRWITPPAGARYAPWAMTRDETGALWFAAGAWRNGNGDEVDEPTPLAVAKPMMGDVVQSHGETERGGRTLERSHGTGTKTKNPDDTDAGASP